MPLYPMRFAFTPGQSERVEAVVTVPKEQRAIIHGTVFDMDGARVPNAVVRLFASVSDTLEHVADTFTDGDGEFVFGPVEAEKSYIVKVYVSGVILREVSIRPKKRTKIEKY